MSRSELERAAATVQQLASQPDTDDGQDAAFRGELLRRYQSLRRFLPALLETISFDAAPAGRPVLEALESLRALEGPGRHRVRRRRRSAVAPARLAVIAQENEAARAPGAAGLDGTFIAVSDLVSLLEPAITAEYRFALLCPAPRRCRCPRTQTCLPDTGPPRS